jgi:hypothetical protein
MKVSTIILTVTLILLLIVTSVFASNVLLKKEYDKVDKSELYMIDGKTCVFGKYQF